MSYDIKLFMSNIHKKAEENFIMSNSSSKKIPIRQINQETINELVNQSDLNFKNTNSKNLFNPAYKVIKYLESTKNIIKVWKNYDSLDLLSENSNNSSYSIIYSNIFF